MQILLIEDEKKIANLIRRGLMEESYSVDIAYNGQEGLEKFDINQYDLIILDLMIPLVSGLEVCRQIRTKNNSIPILILTAKIGIEDKVAGLDAGADDYMTKPFAFSELSARIRALLRRGTKVADSPILKLGDLILDPSKRIAKRGGKTINLTAREYALLEYFMRNPNTVITKTQLIEHVWDYNYDGLSNIVETYVKYLRKKLQISKTAKDYIQTRRGSGYIFTDE